MHPRDPLAWSMLAQGEEALGQRLRAMRAQAEARAALGDIGGAIDRLRAAQTLARTGAAQRLHRSLGHRRAAAPARSAAPRDHCRVARQVGRCACAAWPAGRMVARAAIALDAMPDASPETDTLYQSRLHSLPLLARGKVRDNYAVGSDRLLMVASDRISAFDVVMGQPIPGKGRLLTRMALFWFERLAHVVPNHLSGDDPASVVAADERAQVAGRSMLVKRLQPAAGGGRGARLPGRLGLGRVPALGHGVRAAPARRAAQCIAPGASRSSRRPPRPKPARTTRTSPSRRWSRSIGAELAAARARRLDPPVPRGGRLCAEPRHHHCRHQVRVRPGRGRHADADGRGADARLVALLAAATTTAKAATRPASTSSSCATGWKAAQVDGQPWNKKAPAPALPPAGGRARPRARYAEALRILTG